MEIIHVTTGFDSASKAKGTHYKIIRWIFGLIPPFKQSRQMPDFMRSVRIMLFILWCEVWFQMRQTLSQDALQKQVYTWECDIINKDPTSTRDMESDLILTHFDKNTWRHLASCSGKDKLPLNRQKCHISLILLSVFCGVIFSRSVSSASIFFFLPVFPCQVFSVSCFTL